MVTTSRSSRGMKSWLARKTRLLNSAAGAVAHKLYMWLVQWLRGDYRLVCMIVRWANSNQVDVADLVIKRQVQRALQGVGGGHGGVIHGEHAVKDKEGENGTHFALFSQHGLRV